MTSALRKTFEGLTGGLDYPMLIVTASAGEQCAGCLVGFSSQCSIDPPRFLVCISDKNQTCAVARRAEALAVHFPPASATALARLFGSETGDEIDKFAHCGWRQGPGGLPILDECPRWFAGAILDRQPWGDHIGFVLEPFCAQASGGPDALRFGQVKELEPGHDA